MVRECGHAVRGLAEAPQPLLTLARAQSSITTTDASEADVTCDVTCVGCATVHHQHDHMRIVLYSSEVKCVCDEGLKTAWTRRVKPRHGCGGIHAGVRPSLDSVPTWSHKRKAEHDDDDENVPLNSENIL